MKRIILLIALLHGMLSNAQQHVLPFTGLWYEQNGISAAKITVDLDGAVWTSNRLPVDTEFEIALEDPTGFTEEDGLYFPGIEVLITRRNGDTLGYVADMFGGEAFDGYSGAQLSNLSLTLAFNDQTVPGDTCLLMTRFFDSKGTGELLARMEIVVAETASPLENTWSTFGVSSWEGYSGMSSGIEISNIAAFRDTVTNQQTDLWCVTIDPIIGAAIEEWNAGTLTVTTYDTNGTLSINHPLTYTHTTGASATQDATVATVSIPLEGAGFPLVRIRWENADHTKVMDVVSKPGVND